MGDMVELWALSSARFDPLPPPLSGAFAQSSPLPLNATTWSGVVHSTGRKFTGHVGVIQQVPKLAVEVTRDGCTNHQPVSHTASVFGCQLATNAGFFDFTPPSCEGNLIVNGTTDLFGSGDSRVSVGFVPAGDGTTGSTVVGFVSSPTGYGFASLVSGLGWLVRDGASYVNRSKDITPNGQFTTEKAPRTGVGVRADGTALLLVVDGVETEQLGVDLYEFAEVRHRACGRRGG